MICNVYIDNFLPLKAEFGKIINVRVTTGHTTNFDKVFYPIRLKFLRLSFKTIIWQWFFLWVENLYLDWGENRAQKIFRHKKDKSRKFRLLHKEDFCDLDGLLIFSGITEYRRL